MAHIYRLLRAPACSDGSVVQHDFAHRVCFRSITVLLKNIAPIDVYSVIALIYIFLGLIDKIKMCHMLSSQGQFTCQYFDGFWGIRASVLHEQTFDPR